MRQFYSLLSVEKRAQFHDQDRFKLTKAAQDIFCIKNYLNNGNHMHKANPEDSVSPDVKDLDPNTELLKSSIDRRRVLAKIGKFSAYAVPTALAIFSSKAAHAS